MIDYRCGVRHDVLGDFILRVYNDKGMSNSMFYFFFFTRRIIYILTQFSLQDYPIVQLTLNITLSVAVRIMQNFCYLALFRPFSDPILNISNSSAEAGIFLIFALIGVNLLDVPEYYYDTIDQILIDLINSIIAIQMIASITVCISTVHLKIKMKRREKRKVVIYPIGIKDDAFNDVDDHIVITKP